MKATKNSSVERVLPKKGTDIAIISQIIDWGTVKDSFGSRRKVEFVSELPNQTHVFDEDQGEQPIVIDRKFANNLGTAKRPSGLREFIEAITGGDVDGDEYELEDLLGLAYRVQISIKDDGEYKNVELKNYSSLSPKERKGIEIAGESFVLDLKNFDQATFDLMPQWKRDKIAEAPEYKALGLKSSSKTSGKVSKAQVEDEDEEEEEEEEERPVKKSSVAKKNVISKKPVVKGKTTGRKLI